MSTYAFCKRHKYKTATKEYTCHRGIDVISEEMQPIHGPQQSHITGGHSSVQQTSVR